MDSLPNYSHAQNAETLTNWVQELFERKYPSAKVVVIVGRDDTKLRWECYTPAVGAIQMYTAAAVSDLPFLAKLQALLDYPREHLIALSNIAPNEPVTNIQTVELVFDIVDEFHYYEILGDRSSVCCDLTVPKREAALDLLRTLPFVISVGPTHA